MSERRKDNGQATQEPAEKAGLKMDPEVRAITAMLRILGKLPEPARGRVVAFVYHRYCFENAVRDA